MTARYRRHIVFTVLDRCRARVAPAALKGRDRKVK
jgi:hypothetical protein